MRVGDPVHERGRPPRGFDRGSRPCRRWRGTARARSAGSAWARRSASSAMSTNPRARGVSSSPPGRRTSCRGDVDRRARRRGGVTVSMLPAPPHWAVNARRVEHGREVREQPIVVGHPVERRRREDRVDRIDRDRVEQVVGQEGDPVGAEPFAGALDHRGEASSATTSPRGKSVAERGGDLSGAAPRVEHALVATERQPLEHLEAPAGHRDRQAVVGVGVPVVRHAPRLAAPARGFGRCVLDDDLDLGLLGVGNRDEVGSAATTRSSRSALYQPGS